MQGRGRTVCAVILRMEVANLSFPGQIGHYLAAWNKNTVILTSYS